ncbi:hypothetical protein, partial [Enterococcus faecium]|uniref:hypothetical protein n=1 Tax=Enterococcus faecium TaxID=1352 RepID=UPI001E5B3684
QLHRFDQRSNGFGLTAGRNDEILTRWNLEKILTNRVRGIDSNSIYKLLLVWIGNTKLGITTSLTWDVAVRS